VAKTARTVDELLKQHMRAKGEDLDRRAWADRLEDAGQADAAAALRVLPDLLHRLSRGVQALQAWGVRTERIAVALEDEGRWWVLALAEHGPLGGPRPAQEDTFGTHAALPALCAHWDTLHAGVEWLARQLGMPVVEVSVRPPSGGIVALSPPISLRRQHLCAVADLVTGTPARRKWRDRLLGADISLDGALVCRCLLRHPGCRAPDE
jgi:hypothetical protein